MIRVGVAGALGRLGRVAAQAVDEAKDLELTAAFGRRPGRLAESVGFGGDVPVVDSLDAFYAAGLDVVVDCTVYPLSVDVARGALEAGAAPVIGATGWTDEDLLVLGDLCDERNLSAMLVPNFSLGAILMMRFAAEAARFLPRMEIIELHHDAKRDAPSGTAKLTARRIAEAGGPAEVPIHSVRLPGLVAHQEIIFGGRGETLTIRHDSLARESFAPGIVFAVRNVRRRPGLSIGLEALLFRTAEETV